MRTSIVCSLFLAVATTAVGQTAPPAASVTAPGDAGDVSEVDKDAVGPLRDRVRPVTGHVFLKGHRFELSPSATVSINDAYFTKYLLGGTFIYHFQEAWSVGLRYGYALSAVAGAAQICTSPNSGATLGCRSPRYAEINGQAPGQINMIAGLDLRWQPIYGKIALLAESFVHFDLYAVAGPAAIQYTGPSDLQGDTTRRWTAGGSAGLGARFFLDSWMAFRIELRDLIYVEKVSPYPTNSVRNQLLFELGFSLFFPTVFHEG